MRDNTKPGGREDPQYPARIHRPVTVLMRLPQDGTLRLNLLNPFENETFTTKKGEEVTLSADFTAPLAYAVANSPLFTQENPSLFDPEAFAPMTGLYLSQPYDPDKISIVLVHGLWSSPLMWIWLVNEVWGDPELRARYQVWYYAYPTGLPILANASTFRNNLLALRKQLDPEGKDIATQNMILVGHSMGGLLSKMMVKTTGDRLWNKRFTKPYDSIVANEEERALLKSVAFYEALPFIKRVIFMCVPHRGSTMADGFIGAFGSWLISLPEDLEQKFAAFLAKNPGIVRPHDGEVDLELQDSIKGLSAESPVLNEMDAIPFRPGLPYHSIIGDEEEAGRTGGSDGVVEYWSSHLDGALSEKVVKSGHSATGDQAAMAEVRRILKLHMKGQKQP
jgi:pimeloyl-ACP methyl ester carboxylesterase